MSKAPVETAIEDAQRCLKASPGDLLPILDTGEALVVGDASLLPSRIRINEPFARPNSGTVDFRDEWSTDEAVGAIPAAVAEWRKQTRQT